MNFTKLFRPYNGEQKCCAQIHADHYDNSLQHILSMVKELKKDFNQNNGIILKDEDIKVNRYGGNRIAGITFVEVFFHNDIQIPIGYSLIEQLEYIK